MNITVYCGSQTGNDIEFKTEAVLLGEWIAKNGHTLIYGGGDVGLMGIVASTVHKNGGLVKGIIPQFLIDKEHLDTFYGETIVVETMSERRDKMIELGDAFIALPGGPGTLDEMSEVITLRRLGRIDAPCIFLDINGYYKPMKMVFDNMVKYGFMPSTDNEKISFISTSSLLNDML